MRRLEPMAALLVLLLGLPLTAGDVDREDVARIASNIVCTCGCPPTLVSQCSCHRAGEMTREIEELLAAGKTDEQVYARYVEEFGKQVLAAPKAEGFNLLGWVFPFVALLAGGGIVIFAYRRLRTDETAAKRASEAGPIDEKYRKILEKELEG